jgi:hypothetical protein
MTGSRRGLRRQFGGPVGAVEGRGRAALTVDELSLIRESPTQATLASFRAHTWSVRWRLRSGGRVRRQKSRPEAVEGVTCREHRCRQACTPTNGSPSAPRQTGTRPRFQGCVPPPQTPPDRFSPLPSNSLRGDDPLMAQEVIGRCHIGGMLGSMSHPRARWFRPLGSSRSSPR